MATIWGKIKNLNLQNKLTLSYTVTFTAVIGIAFLMIYQMAEKYRKQEFYQRLKDKTLTSFKLLVEVDQIDRDLLQIFDRNIINSLYEEKAMLFDSASNVIYTSLDDTASLYFENVLAQLKKGKEELKLTDGQYEILGIRFKSGNHVYYGIGKAYDRFGRSKILFLKYLLIITFIIVSFLLIILSFSLSKLITAPVTRLTKSIEHFSTDNLSMRISEPNSKNEVGFLASKFNELFDKVESAFKFQYHFIHHLSHELKTPLAILIANIETATINKDYKGYEQSLEFQKNGLMELSHIINAMLDISKTEHQLTNTLSSPIRIDELLFECMDEIHLLNNDAQFDLKMDSNIENSDNLTVIGNNRMIKMVLMNLLKNATNFSVKQRPKIEVSVYSKYICLSIINDGTTISNIEQKQLFKHLFRGENSKNIKGFGLGLVLTQRIIALHNGEVMYQVNTAGENCFVLKLPLAVV